MRNKKIGTWIATLLITMLTVIGLGQTMVHAVENPEPEGPITNVIITKVQTDDTAKDMTLEQLTDGVDVATYFTDGKVLPGVSFSWYKVDETVFNTMMANPGSYKTAGSIVGDLMSTDVTNAQGKIEINLGEGFYWFIENPKGTIATSAAVPFGLALPFTNSSGKGYLDTVHVYPKNTLVDDEPDIEKTVKEVNVAIGDLNIWTVSLDIPLGIEDYDTFSFYDVIDSRLDFEGIEYVIAAANGIDLVKGTDYTVAYTAPRLDVVFTPAGRIKLKDADPKKVDITIHTRVNDKAIMGQEIENSATLEFNMGHGVDKSKTPDKIPSVHTGGKAFFKRDGSSEVALNGAEFKIQNAQGQFVNVGANGVITFVEDSVEKPATVFTSANGGKFEVRGLPYGSYTLVETKAPQGYALPTNPETGFAVDATSYYAEGTVIESWEDGSNNVKTINNRRLVIPQTGGIGTALFTGIGAVMMLFSALFYRRTKKA